MVEIIATYDFFPGVDQKAWAELAKKNIGGLRKAPGFMEFRGNRILLGSPQVRTTSVFQTMADWAKFAQSPEYLALETEGRRFVTNIEAKIWGPSPVVPEPVRSGQKGTPKVEMAQTFDLLPNIDLKAYGELSRKVMGLLTKAAGFVEFRARRNVLGSPQVLATSAWLTMVDYARFLDSPEWRVLEPEVRTFVANIRVDIWGPSPVVPEPVRP